MFSINEFGKHGDSLDVSLYLFDVLLAHGVMFLDHLLLDLFLNLQLANLLDLVFVKDDARSVSEAKLGLFLEIVSVLCVQQAELCSQFVGGSKLDLVAI